MLTYSQKNFLEQFDQPVRKYIIEYCTKISQKEYDVYILLARKAACFLTVLEELGFIRFNGIVVSDRILEYNTDWLFGKKVAIIDDTIISGTTIYNIICRLKQINVANISVHAFCIDNYWFVNDMLQDTNKFYLEQPYMCVEHASSIRFCRQIVEALSIIPRPYNIDFPIYEIGKLSQRHYSKIIEDSKWKVVDTATLLQKKYNVECASFNFKRELLNQFNNSLGFDISRVLFVKLRIFTKELFDNINIEQSRYLCKVVPYVIFNPINLSILKPLIKSICACETIPYASVENELTTPNSQLLFIQYYFASRLVKWWAEYAEQLLNKKISRIVNQRSLYLLFPPSIVDVVNKFSFNQKINIDLDVLNHDNVLCHSSELSNIFQPVNPLEIKARLTDRFLQLYYTKELPARRIVKEMGKSVFNDPNYKKLVGRLNDGISLDSLKDDISKNVNNATDRNLILSTFLDNAIDKGIIVPITSLNNKYIYRGFRHGEEVIWGDANDKLLAKFFESIAGANGIVPKFWFEKLLVIFLKIGLKSGFLSEYEQSTPENKYQTLIGIRSYLYGQVSVITEIRPYEEVNYNPILSSETKAYWTTKRLQDSGLIAVEENKKGYKLFFEKMFNRYVRNEFTPNDVELDLDQQHVNDALDLAEVMKLCKDSDLLDASGLVLLTSCLSLHDNTSSIGAELQFFIDKIESYITQINGFIRYDNFTIENLASLRDKNKNILWTAINSGKDKFLKFSLHEGVKLVERIGKQLSNLNSFAARRWNDYWCKDIELLKSQDKELQELNSRMGVLLIDIQLLISCIHLILFELIRRENILQEYFIQQEALIDNLDKNIEQLQSKCSIGHLKIQNLIKKNNSKKRKILNGLKYWENYVEKNIETIRYNWEYIVSHQYSQTLNFDFITNFINQSYNGLTTEQLHDTVDKCNKLLKQLKIDAEDALKDFSALVPQWGKVRKTVRYLSFLYLNIGSNDRVRREKIGQIIKAELTNFELDEYADQKNEKSIVLLKVYDVKIGGRGYVLGAKGQWHDERLMKLGCRILARCLELKEHIKITLCPFFSPNGYRAYFNTQTQAYDIVKEDLYQELPKNEDEDCINVFVPDTRQNEKYVSSILKKYILHNTFKWNLVAHDNNIIQFQIIMESTPKKIFISYSRKDVEYKNELKKHLSLLGLTNIIDTWSCEDITIGLWEQQIQKNLNDSDLIIYMLSANFFTSSYIIEQEVQAVMANGPRQNILCVIVSQIPDLLNIPDNSKQKYVITLSRYQHLPYGQVKNEVTGQTEEKIVPLKDYRNVTGKSIENAFTQIVKKIIELFS